jgi:hypothetical protein
MKNEVYELFKRYNLHGHSSLMEGVQGLIDQAQTAGHSKGVDEGAASQAIIESQGRALYVAGIEKRILTDEQWQDLLLVIRRASGGLWSVDQPVVNAAQRLREHLDKLDYRH